MNENILREHCANHCRVTWHGNYGPNRSLPGTHGGTGDVRRCEHGHIWLYERTTESRFYCEMDLWRRVSRFWEPLTYRRAMTAIATTTPAPEPARDQASGTTEGELA